MSFFKTIFGGKGSKKDVKETTTEAPPPIETPVKVESKIGENNEVSNSQTTKKYTKEEEAKFQYYVEKLGKLNISVKDYEDIIREDDETTKMKAKMATKEEIKYEIELLIGKYEDWCTEDEQVIHFREKISKARKESMANVTDVPAQQTLPPVYLSSEVVPPNQPKKFYCIVNLKESRKTVECNGEDTAEQFAEQFLKKRTNVTIQNTNPENWIFKATGTEEYLYGKHKMQDFEHIRKCLKRGERVVLTLMDKAEVLANTDQSAHILKSVKYNFNDSSIFDTKFNHDEIKFNRENILDSKFISLWDLTIPFRVRIKGVDLNVDIDKFYTKKHRKQKKREIKDPDEAGLYVVAQVFHGCRVIGKPRVTRLVRFSKSPRFFETLEFPDLLVADIPREARIAFTIYANQKCEPKEFDKTAVFNPTEHLDLGWVNLQLIDYKGYLFQGPVSVGMYLSGTAKPAGQSGGNVGDDVIPFPPSLQLLFDEYLLPVVFPSSGTIPESAYERFQQYLKNQAKQFKELPKSELEEQVNKYLKYDALHVLTEEESWRIYQMRDELKKNPNALPKFLKSVNWGNPVAIKEAHRYLEEWAPLDPIDSLELLSFNFGDSKVKMYAIQKLNELDDNALHDVILQLVQTLKYEPYHDSPLARFLLQRAIHSTHLIGHTLFWYLKAEMHVGFIRERHGLILEEYLTTCGVHRRELVKHNGVVEQLLRIAMKIKQFKKPDEQLKTLREELTELVYPPKFKLPYNPRIEVNKVIPNKCKVMQSKKLPLWLVFENADELAPNVSIIFKAGDDLRQDLLTLQLMKIVDNMWKKEGLDLHLQPYGCINTGDGVGMIEVVTNSNTIANITNDYGGASAALSKQPLKCWLQDNNKSRLSDTQELPNDVITNFVYSCAGYCVFTYVLGIGDRHNDNIMLTRTGDLFHIDFGHFLGHFKTKFGVKRETTPFVFDQMYAAVMGGEDSEHFKHYSELACKAYNIVRKNGRMLINLMMLMLATGIPELTSEEDIKWLRGTLILDKTDEEAKNHFQKLIKLSLSNITVKLNNVVHIVGQNLKA